MKGIEVAAGLVFQAGKLLLTQRRDKDHLGGLWEFPGGKREPNETIEDCLVRELQEELGIVVRVLESIATLTHDYPTVTVHLHFFLCALAQGNPQPIGCQNFAWVTAAELDRYPFPPADAQLLNSLRSQPNWWRHSPPL